MARIMRAMRLMDYVRVFPNALVALSIFLQSYFGAYSQETAEQFVSEVQGINCDYYGTTAYLGTRHAYDAIRVKVEQLLTLEEKTDETVIPSGIQQSVFLARSFDLFALSIIDSQRAFLTGEKVSPVEGLPGLITRHVKLATEKANQDQFLSTLNFILGKKQNAWFQYARGRNEFNPKLVWPETLRRSLGEFPELEPFLEMPERSNPFSQFHNLAVGIPSVSDEFPNLWKGVRNEEGRDLGNLSDGPFEIPIENLTGTVSIRLTITNDTTEPLNIAIEATEGAIGLSLGAIRAVAWEGGNDEISNGDILVPSDYQSTQEPFFINRTDVSGFEKFTKPSSGILRVRSGNK